MPPFPKSNASFRRATLSDLDALLGIEQRCFSGDQLSRRSFKRHITSEHSQLLLADIAGQVAAYGLVFRLRGTRLARLYSLAVDPNFRGLGLANDLLSYLEQAAAAQGRQAMRLEVAKDNQAAISLYQRCGYRQFGEYSDYYEDHGDALRMQKIIKQMPEADVNRTTPWYQQTTEFTCGPASLMMAMSSLNQQMDCSIGLELDLWREATTVFMTSGHGGCHPLGLAASACRRGFHAQVWLSTDGALFVDGVRSEKKKQIMQVVHEQFLQACEQLPVDVHYNALSSDQLEQCLLEQAAVLVLISTYRLDGKKAPHWVVVTGMDEHCFYLHDPDYDDEDQLPIDCQHVPIARADFEKMSMFGSTRLRAALAIKWPS